MNNKQIASKSREMAAMLGRLGPEASHGVEETVKQFEQTLGITQRHGLAISTRLLYCASRAESLDRVGLHAPMSK